MRILPVLSAALLAAFCLSGCVAYDVAGAAVDATATVAGTAVDATGAVVGGAIHAVTPGGADARKN